MTLIPDLSDLVIAQVRMTTEVTITVRAASPTPPCPCCGTISKRIQSRYTRTVRDLPASGRPVHLVIHVRRFFCQERTCMRKIFAERFPSLTLPRVKFTLRLQEAQGEFDTRQRSEEHTSELQSPDHLVCRLLLDIKKSSFVHYRY